MEYKVGTRVRCVNNVFIHEIKGLIGRIVCVYGDVYYSYGIEFEKSIHSYENCEGYGRYGHCCWVGKDDIIICNSKERIK